MLDGRKYEMFLEKKCVYCAVGNGSLNTNSKSFYSLNGSATEQAVIRRLLTTESRFDPNQIMEGT
jgi:hypothetical protein